MIIMGDLKLFCDYCGLQLTYRTIDDKIMVEECEYCKEDEDNCDDCIAWYNNNSEQVEELEERMNKLQQTIIDSKETNLEKIQTQYDFMYNI